VRVSPVHGVSALKGSEVIATYTRQLDSDGTGADDDDLCRLSDLLLVLDK